MSMRWAKCEFHCHSGEDPWDRLNYTAENLLDRAATLGFDFLALTHHTRVHFPQSLQERAAALGITMVPSCELCLEGKDLLVLNAPENLPERLTRWGDLREFRKASPESLIIAPHPHHVVAGSMGEKTLRAFADCLDAVEICHFYTKLINPALRTLAFARRHGMPTVATSDAHSLRGFGHNYTLVEIEGETSEGNPPAWEEIAGAIRAGKTRPIHTPIPFGRFMKLLTGLLIQTLCASNNPRKRDKKRRKSSKSAGQTTEHGQVLIARSAKRPENRGMPTAPVLVICFDRPEKAALLLSDLKTLQGKLFLFRDGGGSEKFKQLFAETKTLRPDGTTEILIEEENLGGRDGPWRAIQWFFSQVEAGIVLEEDIVPDKAMVACYTKALEAFADDQSVFALGSAPNKNVRAPGKEPWTRSPLFLVWGWASWADRIASCQTPNDIWQTTGKSLLLPFCTLTARLYLKRELEKLAANPKYCWSYYPQLQSLASHRDILIPETKLTQNTGIGRNARRSRTNPDARPDPGSCAKMLAKPAGANRRNPGWQAKVEKAKFMGLTHELRNRLRLGSRLRKLLGK